MSTEPEDQVEGDRLGIGLIAGVAAFVVTYNLTKGGFLALGSGALGFLIASAQLSGLVRYFDTLFNKQGVPVIDIRKNETVSGDTIAAAERYWASYDSGQIWEQRSEDIETSGTYVTHYAALRRNIPELAGPSLRPTPEIEPIGSQIEPLRDFWNRYHHGDSERAGATVKGTAIGSIQPQPTYRHLPPHLALIDESREVRQKLLFNVHAETGAFASNLADMVKNVDIIINAVSTAPARLGDVHRLFTYYLPEVGKLLDARQHMIALEQTQRVVEIEAVVDRIEKAFEHFARRMHDADIRALDIDLKLLDQSLAAEFETQIGT